MKNYIISFLFVFIFSNLSAQDELIQLQNYFKNDVETIYIHTNKNKYVVGEYLWFKAYVYNLSQGKASTEAISAEVNIYNTDKKLIASKKYVITNGVFTGDFKIDSTFTGGRYYIQAHTQFMKEKDSKSHVQEFSIVDLSIEEKSDFASKQFDLQILPEGGHAVYGLDSSFGIKLINSNGLGESFSANLLEDGKLIKKISSNQFGHAKFNWIPKKKSSYQIDLRTDKGIELTKRIEDIKEEGATIQLNPLLPELLYVQLQKNFKKDYSTYSMLVHQFGEGKKIDLEFEDGKSNLAIPKDELFAGINTLRVFKDDRPILERLYFKKTEDIVEFDGEIIETTNKSNDSISVKLFFHFENSQKMLSASVLPSETKTYTKKTNIISSVRLASHLRGEIENEAYYFMNESTNEVYNLDLLLLLQGWSKYSWQDITRTDAAVYKSRRNGINYKVLLDEKPKSTDNLILFHGSAYNEPKVASIDKSINEVTFENMYPLVGEKLKFSYVNRYQSFKAPNLTLEIEDFTIDTILNDKNIPLKQSSLVAESVKLNNVSEAFINTDVLDEILIATQKKPKKEVPKTIKPYEKYYAIGEKDVQNSRTLAVFLSKRGIRALEDGNGSLIVAPLRPVSINAGAGVAFYLDGALLHSLDFLAGAQLSQFESITINKYGFGKGFFGANGAIYLESRSSSFFGNKSSDMFTELEAKNGYRTTKKFYNPAYVSYDNLFFKNYGTISWSPQILLDENNHTLELRIKNTNLDYTIFVEGVDSNGKLHSYQIKRKAQ